MKTHAKIAASEWAVMRVVWEEHPVTANTIIEVLSKSTDWTPETIRTLINRLMKKGVLGHEREGRAYVYTPLVDEADCVRSESQSFLQRVYGGAAKPMLVGLIEECDLSAEDIESLRDILDKKAEGGTE